MSNKKGSIRLTEQMLSKIVEDNKQFHASAQRGDDEFVLSVEDLPSLPRAEAWLRYVVKQDTNYYSTQEAIVYLISRGNDCKNAIENIKRTWKNDEKHAIEICMREIPVIDVYTGETKRIGRKKISFEEASDVLNQSIYRLSDFWPAPDGFEASANATMLRTVEWCNIGGFNDWWLRLANTDYEMIVQGGVDAIPASSYLFDLCRSDFAIDLMSKSLIKMLDAIELPESRQVHPWRRHMWTEPPIVVDHFSYVATIIFANLRLHTKDYDSELLDKAAEVLLRNQETNNGYWQRLSNENVPAIETTAMAIHALALYKPRGWELAVSTARDWLLSVQDRSGCWIDYSCPDSVYLTVLVLDAIELAEGGSKVTFNLENHRTIKGTDKDELLDIKQRLDNLQLDLWKKTDELKKGQAAIYKHIGSSSRFTLIALYQEIHEGRIEQGQLLRTIDAIRRALRHIQTSGLPIDNEVKKMLDAIYVAVNSDLSFSQKVELTLPIIPLLLEYKVEVGAGVDLEAVWAELKDKIRKTHPPINRNVKERAKK